MDAREPIRATASELERLPERTKEFVAYAHHLWKDECTFTFFELERALVAYGSSEYARGLRDGMERAAKKADSWGDACAGGSGGEIILSGPSKGQRYGEGYYNLAKSIRQSAEEGK